MMILLTKSAACVWNQALIRTSDGTRIVGRREDCTFAGTGGGEGYGLAPNTRQLRPATSTVSAV